MIINLSGKHLIKLMIDLNMIRANWPDAFPNLVNISAVSFSRLLLIGFLLKHSVHVESFYGLTLSSWVL